MSDLCMPPETGTNVSSANETNKSKKPRSLSRAGKRALEWQVQPALDTHCVGSALFRALMREAKRKSEHFLCLLYRLSQSTERIGGAAIPLVRWLDLPRARQSDRAEVFRSHIRSQSGIATSSGPRT